MTQIFKNFDAQKYRMEIPPRAAWTEDNRPTTILPSQNLLAWQLLSPPDGEKNVFPVPLQSATGNPEYWFLSDVSAHPETQVSLQQTLSSLPMERCEAAGGAHTEPEDEGECGKACPKVLNCAKFYLKNFLS